MRLPTSWIAIAIAVAGPFASLQDAKDEATVPTAPKVGDLAPTFRLNDHDGDAAQIGGASDHWTILAFYPKAMTPG